MRRAANWRATDFRIRRSVVSMIQPLDNGFARQTGRCVDGRRTPERRDDGFAGPLLRSASVLGPMLAQAMADGKPVASDPLPLLRPGWSVRPRSRRAGSAGGRGSPAGFVTFSYELAPLMLTNDDLSLFSVVLKDPSHSGVELIADRQGVVTSGTAAREGPAPSMVRTVTFGGRDWSLGYYAKTNAVNRAQQTAAIVAAIGLALTGIVCGLFGYVAYQQSATEPRDPGENRFRTPIDRGDRRTQSPRQEHPCRDPVDRDADAAPRFRHRCRPRTPDRPHPRDVERGLAAQRKPVAGRAAERAVRGPRRSPTPNALRSMVPISPSARGPRKVSRCCSSNWHRIPTRGSRWSASTLTSSCIGK